MYPMTKTINGGSCHKYHFHGDKSFVVTNTCMLQHVFCCDKSMLVVFVTTKIFCGDKTFVGTNNCHDKHIFVVTKDMF